VHIVALVKAGVMLSRWGFRGWSKSVWASLKADNVFSMTINPAQTDTPMTACALSCFSPHLRCY
jgi:short-subunit dehydrogenase